MSLVVTCFVINPDLENEYLLNLKNRLKEKDIILNTDPDEELPDDIIFKKAFICAYSQNVKKINITIHNEIPGLPKYMEYNNCDNIVLNPKDPNDGIYGCVIFHGFTFILIKLDSCKKLKINTNYPHIFVDLSENFIEAVLTIEDFIKKAEINDPNSKEKPPSQDEIQREIKRNRILKKDFPYVGSQIILPGTKIYGGRGFMYDCDGVILDIDRINNTGDLNEDWEFAIGFYAYEYNGWYETQGRFEWFNITEYATRLLDLYIPDKKILFEARPIIKSVDDELMAFIAKNPNFLKFLNPDAFEDLIVNIYKNQGFEVERIGKWNQADGGVDILAINRSFPSGTLNVAIQCKTSKNLIKPSIIRELNGVLDRFNAHIGVVATNSGFTSKTIEEIENDFWRIKVEDCNSIIKKLNKIFK